MSDITHIDRFIQDGKNNTISLKNFYDTILVGDAEDDTNIYRIPIDDFFLKYHKELEPSITVMTCDESYFYKPKLFSYQYYGTTELWLALLRVNGIVSTCNFNYPFIRVYEPYRAMEIIKTYFKREGKY